MANLLQKASIVLTPTAYDNGKVLCAKPSEPPYGDFDFSRNSAATRVNAQGLVENVQILSSNLVQNGDFSEEGAEEVSNGYFSQEGAEQVTNGDFATDSDWNLGSGINISGGSVNFTGVPNANINQNAGLSTGKTYKIVFTISNYVSGDIDYNVGGATRQGAISGNGTYTDYVVSSTGQLLYFQSDQTLGFTGSIENVSVREVGQDWEFGTGWSIADNKVVAVSGTASKLRQTNNLNGKSAKVTFTVSDYSSGILLVDFGSTSSPTINANGDYVFYGTYDQNNFEIYKSSNFIGSITNISVKEVGQNWDLQSEWSIGTNKAIYDNSSSGNLTQSFTWQVGKRYKITFDIGDFTNNQRFDIYSGVSFIKTATAENNTSYEIYFNGDGGTTLRFRGLTTESFSVTNISIIEITDDTNLPRINYEGFSYQDALGSENIDLTAGNTLDASAWGSVTTSGVSYLGGTGSLSYYNTGFIVTAGLTYKLSITISDYTGSDDLGFSTAGGVSTSARLSANGTYTEYFTATSNTGLRIFGRPTNTGVFSNVSVKEYSGQEVVPNSGCGSWLWEPQSTNLITYSEDFSQWIASGCTVGNSSSVVSPSNSNNIGIITGTIGTGAKFARINVITSSSIITYSAFFKYNSHQWVQFASGGTSEYANFDIQNGVVGNKLSGTTSTIDNFGNGWYRCTLSTSVASTPSNMAVVLIDTANSSRLEATSSVGSAYIWGAQFEQQSYATSYIPTSGSSVTRNQDVCTNGGSLATINSTEGTLYVEATIQDTSTFKTMSRLTATDISTSDGLWIYARADNKIQGVLRVGGVDQVALTSVSTFSGFVKAAFKYSLNNFSLWINGIEIATDTSGSVFPVNTLSKIGFKLGTNTNPFYGKTKCVAVWKEALSDQELADLTYPTPTDPTFTLDFDTIAEQFTFARGSEATYVDAQGLIQSTNELGSELVLNGNFDTDSDWNKNSNWSISGGEANCDGTSNGDINQGTTLATIGKSYKISYEVVSISQGEFFFKFGGVNGTMRNSIGVYTETIQAINTNRIALDSNNNAIGSIDNVSVKEVISATNTPRLDYSTGAEAFLLEPQSTNLIPYSEDFSSLNIRSNAVVTSNQIISPSGLLDADEITFDGTFSGRVEASISAIVGQPYTISLYLKNKDLSDVTQVWIGFSVLSQGQFVTITDEWQRYDITTNADGATEYPRIQFSGTGSLYAWGFQTEQQSYATSYIPTSGTTVTRNQETCINATPEINSTEGTLFFEGSGLVNGGNNRYISLSDNTSSNRVQLVFAGTANRLNVSGTNIPSINYNSFVQTNNNKIALSYSALGVRVFVNGVLVGSNTNNASLPANTLTTLDFALWNQTTVPFYGKVKALQVYTKALSDAELIKLTT